MTYCLTLYPYCGGSRVLCEGGRDDCRKRAAAYIRYHRNKLEYPVSILMRGKEWELESDVEGRYMIGEHEGLMTLDEIRGFEPDEDQAEFEWDLAEALEDAEDEEPTEPEEGDWFTEDYVTFREYGGNGILRVPLGGPWQPAVKIRMDQDQFWPNVWLWQLPDHGNYHLLSLEDDK